MIEFAVVVWALILGLIIGSFLNVVIYRVPRNETLMGRSHCPGCARQIAAFDNVPVFSWMLLRGKCRRCKTKISIQYPIVELVTGIVFAGVAVMFGLSLLTLTLWFFASASIALFVIDLQTLRLPDKIVFPTVVVVGLGLAGTALVENQADRLATSAVAAVALLLFYLFIWIITSGRGLGFGDVKLSPALGLVMGYFGWGAVAVGTASAWLLGAIIGVAGILVGRLKRGNPIPFGPFLIVGAWVGVLWGEEVFNSYWSFMQGF